MALHQKFTQTAKLFDEKTSYSYLS